MFRLFTKRCVNKATFLKITEKWCLGSSACEGDSGGGLVFPSREQRYYIRGVVSVAPKGPFESCDADEYTLYTKVSQHIDFISEADSLAKSL